MKRWLLGCLWGICRLSLKLEISENGDSPSPSSTWFGKEEKVLGLGLGLDSTLFDHWAWFRSLYTAVLSGVKTEGLESGRPKVQILR